MKATELLIQEHKTILRALDVLDAMAVAATDGCTVEDQDIWTILHFLRWFGDARHQAKEERILFPALKVAAASQARGVDHMALEHDQERALINEIETDLCAARLPDLAARANRLSTVLRNHIYKEDHILFEVADAVLDARADAAVLEQLRSFNPPADEQALENVMADLRRLEWRYLGRSPDRSSGVRYVENQADPLPR